MKNVLQKEISFVLLKKMVSICGIAGRRRVKLRITPAGSGFMVLMLCGFLLSVNFSNNMIFAMTFLLVGVAVVGCWQTRANLVGLEYGVWRCSPVFVKQEIEYQLVVANPSASLRYGLYMFCRGIEVESEKMIEGNARKTLKWRTVATDRGLMKGKPVELRSRFPLGLFEARLNCGILPDCLVYPAPVGAQKFLNSSQLQMAHQKRESGDYVGMRRYVAGDPPSRIAWKALARTDELFTGEYDGAEGNSALWFCWEDVQTGTVEQKLSQLCRWVLDAHHRGQEYGLELPATVIKPGCAEKHKCVCLRVLALHDMVEQNK